MPLVAQSPLSSLPTMQPSHSAVTSGDLELLDMLTSTPSAFPHQSPMLSSGVKTKPLSTLNALRRPPIDPMVLAASLSSGPHVTRHHFHHSFGAGENAHKSTQMPASQRKLQEQHDKEELSYQQKTPRSRPRKLSTASGSYANCDIDDFQDVQASSSQLKIQPVPEVTDEEGAFYASRQAPRSVRMQREKEERERQLVDQANQAASTSVSKSVPIPGPSQAPPDATAAKHKAPLAAAATTVPSQAHAIARALDERKAAVSARATPPPTVLPTPAPATTPLNLPTISSIVRPPPLMVRCYARTRIPTPHGEIFCHLYRNNHDAKEHLALVVDPQQNDEDSLVLGPDGRPTKENTRAYQRKALRSKTLDEVWGPHETEMERIVRGAYVGRLGPSFQVASKPVSRDHLSASAEEDAEYDEPAPLVRIHSECYTGETIGSQRCDCGEQLDEALRLISEGHQSHGGKESQQRIGSSPLSLNQPLPRGVVVYLRQEGRGIGLLDKLMAYNLQDMGHDTVSANILLGHLPDARKYDIASAILHDLGVNECRLLTNNPEKMEALESEGVRVTERVGMVPRAWKCGHRAIKRPSKSRRARNRGGKAQPMDASFISQAGTSDTDDGEGDASDDSDDSYVAHVLRKSGATLIGSSITRGPELEKYLRTKVQRMGHLLDLPDDVHSQPYTDDESQSLNTP